MLRNIMRRVSGSVGFGIIGILLLMLIMTLTGCATTAGSIGVGTEMYPWYTNGEDSNG